MKALLRIVLAMLRTQQRQTEAAILESRILHGRIDNLERILRLTLANLEPDVCEDLGTINEMMAILRKSRISETARRELNRREIGVDQSNAIVERLGKLIDELST